MIIIFSRSSKNNIINILIIIVIIVIAIAIVIDIVVVIVVVVGVCGRVRDGTGFGPPPPQLAPLRRASLWGARGGWRGPGNLGHTPEPCALDGANLAHARLQAPPELLP